MSFKQVHDRAARMEYAVKLRKKHPEWSEERLADEVAVVTGVTPYTAIRYVELLKKTGRWTS